MMITFPLHQLESSITHCRLYSYFQLQHLVDCITTSASVVDVKTMADKIVDVGRVIWSNDFGVVSDGEASDKRAGEASKDVGKK